MDLNLPVEANDFVKSHIAQGRYQSEEEAIVEGIRLLKGRKELRKKIAAGVGQLDRGESLHEDTAFDEAEPEIRRIESRDGRPVVSNMLGILVAVEHAMEMKRL